MLAIYNGTGNSEFLFVKNLTIGKEYKIIKLDSVGNINPEIKITNDVGIDVWLNSKYFSIIGSANLKNYEK